VAIVMSRLGMRIDNSILVPVPIFRSRTRMKDVVIDLAAMVGAAFRVTMRRPRSQPVPSLVPPVLASAGLAALALSPLLVARRLLRRRR
jgi:hypothetical protein